MKIKISVTKLADLLAAKAAYASLTDEYHDLSQNVKSTVVAYENRISSYEQRISDAHTENDNLRHASDMAQLPLYDTIASMVLALSAFSDGGGAGAVQHIRDGRKILAIKTLREQFPTLGLRECKMIIDKIAQKIGYVVTS